MYKHLEGAIIWCDIDGTLGAPTELSYTSLYDAFMNVTGRSATGIWNVTGVGTDYQRIQTHLDLEHKDLSSRPDIVWQIMLERERLYTEGGADQVHYFPDVIPGLTGLQKEGARIGIITGNPDSIARAKVKDLLVRGLVDPELFLTGEMEFRAQLVHIASKLTRFPSLMFVGDSYSDVEMVKYYVEMLSPHLIPSRNELMRKAYRRRKMKLREQPHKRSNLRIALSMRANRQIVGYVSSLHNSETDLLYYQNDVFEHIGDYWMRMNLLPPNIASKVDLERQYELFSRSWISKEGGITQFHHGLDKEEQRYMDYLEFLFLRAEKGFGGYLDTYPRYLRSYAAAPSSWPGDMPGELLNTYLEHQVYSVWV